jgi:transcriptional regulator with XRE-family HTH domain
MNTNPLSSVYLHVTMIGMNSSLGQLIREWRERSGLSLAQAAAIVGIGRGHLSQFETGRIGLPQTEVRRRLAQALGITHIDLLIAAGELSVEEVQQAGVVGVAERSPDDPRTPIHALVDQINWYRREDRIAGIMAILQSWRDADRHY